VHEVLELQYKKLGSKAAPNSLKLCTTDGKKIVAIRFRNHESLQPPSLY
jgi:glutamine amidotransferase